MTQSSNDIFVGVTPIHAKNKQPQGATVDIGGEPFYQIQHVDQMPPFFMTLVSGADHWLFIASNGGLTAGRTDANSALFPYETEDKLMANADRVGSTTLLRVARNGRVSLWEPLSEYHADLYRTERNLHKNFTGSALIFEEINHDLDLTWRTAWRTGDRYGFIKTSWLQNDGDACQITLLDGLQNVLPYGVSVAMQQAQSNLLNAYKRSELDAATGLGIFSLTATLTDRAEPSESLMATVVWQTGLTPDSHLLSANQLDAFRRGQPLTAEHDLKGQAGAYFMHTTLSLTPGETRQWHIIADVNQDSAAVIGLRRRLQRTERAALAQELEADIAATTAVLHKHVAAADGLQQTAAAITDAYHFANVMFNVMRGGIFVDGYQVQKEDLLAFVARRNRPVVAEHEAWFAALPPQLSIDELYRQAEATAVPDLIRLCYEYLPLTFSRRHGDPSRPWNRFAINLKHANGDPRLDYQGNWRDIFQNWEPLTLSFPAYTTGIIAKFLNATTADGYNPYRVTRAGIEWEAPEPENPWANIGYWSDHQIIYLQKLLEIAAAIDPQALPQLWAQPIFAYADVPYRLKPYRQMLADWYNTIDFDWEKEKATAREVARMGTDGRLLRDAEGRVVHANMMEKLLVLLLAKLTNLVPGGGIWMNTQRPEWNDANNALVGKGLSVVTAAYLRRFIVFWRAQMTGQEAAGFAVNTAVAKLFDDVRQVLQRHQTQAQTGFDDRSRRTFMDELGAAATAYREKIYRDNLPAAETVLSGQTIAGLLALAQGYIEETLRANRRPDHLYHTYNILELSADEAAVSHLYPMLEGQVAILSAGLLSAKEALALLHSLRHSDLYRADQHTYMLYPNRELPGFLDKNHVPADRVTASPLAQALTAADDVRLLTQDEAGDFHFSGRFRNAADVHKVLAELATEPVYADLVAAERDDILELFEETFNHRAFTGRSGTFYAYEGLGSIYWHMVSKLLLAVQECYQQAVAAGEKTAVTDALAAAYADVRAGLGFNKSPDVYGAFPTDPYSHTPLDGGARQPGMTGQVKEGILARWGELGVVIKAGVLAFVPRLLSEDEFLADNGRFGYIDVRGEHQLLFLPDDSLAFTFCQTPIVYTRGERACTTATLVDGKTKTAPGHGLNADLSGHILSRDGFVRQVQVIIPPT